LWQRDSGANLEIGWRADACGYGGELYVDDDGDWLAHFEELPSISAFGATPEDALRELAIAWRLVKESYAEENKPVPVPPNH
jgi:predicted RNase H-like HicB family nuclease